ncbi:MAG TPA: sigma-E factor regulatory protein RseB domain-containing protein [Planctomycetota bacterium]|nr:sigma-E factor regulatory protein RseB domain-containing protein [Planctomycetota bacterium]
MLLALQLSLLCIQDPSTELEKLLGTLQSDDAEERERAAYSIAKMGTAVLPRLKQISATDPDFKSWIARIIETIEFGQAAKLLLRVEETLQAARSLEIRVSGTVDVPEEGTFSASLYWDRPRKRSRDEFHLQSPALLVRFRSIFDGAGGVCTWSTGGEEAKTGGFPIEVKTEEWIIRLGLGTLIRFDRPVASIRWRLSNLKMKGRESVQGREAQVIEFVAGIDGVNSRYRTTLWIDSESHVPLKRLQIEISLDNSEVCRLTENYEVVRIDHELDGKLFEIPSEGLGQQR